MIAGDKLYLCQMLIVNYITVYLHVHMVYNKNHTFVLASYYGKS